MFKGMKQAVKCTKCGELTFFNDGDEAFEQDGEKSNCCGAKNEYVGFQPYVDKVLVFAKPVVANQNNTVMNMVTAAAKLEPIIEQIKPEQPKLEIVGKRGKMTTLIMRDMVREAVEQNNLSTVKELANQYPEEYNDCLRYLPAKIKKYIG